ncbi:MAG: NUDIX domain-containing protein [Dehalococcoidia bacterium]
MNLTADSWQRFQRLYWRIARPVTFGVRAIVERPNGHVLLVRHTYPDDRWYLPGGGIEAGEDPERALTRELFEEAGIDAVTIKRKLGTYANRFEGKRDTVEVFVARAETIGALQPSEIAAAGWFDPRALPGDTSPGTRRRVLEFLGDRVVSPDW